jgi:hypothetical protein
MAWRFAATNGHSRIFDQTLRFACLRKLVDPLQRHQEFNPLGITRTVDRSERRVQQLARDAARERSERLLGRGAVLQRPLRALELRLAQRVVMLAERRDGRHHRPAFQPAWEVRGLFRDYLLGLRPSA